MVSPHFLVGGEYLKLFQTFSIQFVYSSWLHPDFINSHLTEGHFLVLFLYMRKLAMSGVLKRNRKGLEEEICLNT